VTNKRPLVIVQCAFWEKIFPRFSEVSGDVDAVIRPALSATNCDIVVVRVCEGEMLRKAREFSAVVISGSPVMVGDPDHAGRKTRKERGRYEHPSGAPGYSRRS
jgi:hypothetical protein